MLAGFEGAKSLIIEMQKSLMPIRESVRKGSLLLNEIHDHISGVVDISHSILGLIERLQQEAALQLKYSKSNLELPSYIGNYKPKELQSEHEEHCGFKLEVKPLVSNTGFSLDNLTQSFCHKQVMHSKLISFIQNDLELLNSFPDSGNCTIGLDIVKKDRDSQIAIANEAIRKVYQKISELSNKRGFEI